MKKDYTEYQGEEKDIPEEKQEELSEVIKKKLHEAAADFSQTLEEERGKRNEIKSIEEEFLTSLDKETEAFNDRLKEQFSASTADDLNEQLEKATATGDLEEISRILKRME